MAGEHTDWRPENWEDMVGERANGNYCDPAYWVGAEVGADIILEVLKGIVKLEWGADNSILSVQVWTKRLDGREFPAYANLCDIKSNGEILWNNQEAKRFRKELLAQLLKQQTSVLTRE